MNSTTTSSAPILEPVRAPFRAIASTVVPEMSALKEGAWQRAEAIVEDALASRPPEMHRQLRLFLRVVNWLAVPRTGRKLTSLSPERRLTLCRELERFPVLLIRRGFWGVRTLALMGYYGLPEVRVAIGYRADPGGWEARGLGPSDESRGKLDRSIRSDLTEDR